MDYQEFKADFKRSGLSQAEYGKKIGKSASMVSYYLKRARLVKEDVQNPSFSKLEVIDRNLALQVIRIKTASGLEVEIPV
jgi:transcriptional regulator with XRE-family HTH domain